MTSRHRGRTKARREAEYAVDYENVVSVSGRGVRIRRRHRGGRRSEREGTAVIVLTIPAEGHDPAGEKPALTFARHETQYRLTDIWESRSEGREIAGQ
jgi:hypothetical protein